MDYEGGGSGLIGGLWGGFSAASMAKKAKREAQRNRDFQERMSSTAHQREVADLRAAGLNPMLSGTGGSGASSPAGNVAPVPDIGAAAMAGIQSGVSSAHEFKKGGISGMQKKVEKEKLKFILGKGGKKSTIPLSVYKQMGISDDKAIAMAALHSGGNSAKSKFQQLKEKMFPAKDPIKWPRTAKAVYKPKKTTKKKGPKFNVSGDKVHYIKVR